jgi:lipoate synthase
MFNIFKKRKKIDTSQIKDFDNILRVIKDFIYFEDFEKASAAINEVIEKENESFNHYINTVPEKKKKEEIGKFKKKLDKIYKLKKINEEAKKKFEIKLYNKKKKEEMRFVEKKIIELI